jgi:hypothetical protein
MLLNKRRLLYDQIPAQILLPETFVSKKLEKGVYYNRKWTTDTPKDESNNYFVNYAACNIIFLRTTLCFKKTNYQPI